MAFRTEYEFTLPSGYVDEEGSLHNNGIMRLATAADEILPQKDPRVKQNPAYLIVILLSRVITKIGDITNVTTHTIEKIFKSDFEYLQDFYQRINRNGSPSQTFSCPKCEHEFEVETHYMGEL